MKILNTGSTTTAPANLKTGELAYSWVTGTVGNNGDRLYIGTGTESGGVASAVVEIGGLYYVNLLKDVTPGTLAANKALIVNGNKHINELNIGSLALEASGGSGQVVTSIETSMGASPTDAQLITAQGVKEYVDAEVAVGYDLDFSGDSGSGTITNSETLAITGGTGLTSTASGNGLSIVLDNTDVTAGSYGSSTAIPTFTVDAQGRLTAAGTASITTSLTIQSDDASDNTVSLASDKLKLLGGTGITSTNTGDDVTFNLDNTAVSAGSYGSATLIPTFTVDAQGRLTDAGTAAISTTLDLAADSGTDDGVLLGTDTLRISGTNNEIETSVSGDTITVGIVSNPTLSGNVIVTGNLTVSGTTTSVNTTEVTLNDPVMVLANNTSSDDGEDRGVRFKWYDGSAVKEGFFGFDYETQRFVFTKDEDFSGGEDASSPWHDAEFGNVYGTGADFGAVTVGLTDDNTITTTSGKLILDSNTNEVEVNANLDLNGDLDVSGSVTLGTDLAVTHGGTGVSSFTGDAVFISNAGGTAISYLASSKATVSTSTNGDMIAFSGAGVPFVTDTIDGGTY